MRKQTLWTIILLVAMALQLIAQVLLSIAVLRLDMLPGKYLALFLGLMLLFACTTVALMFVRGKKKTIGVGRRAVALILAIIMIVLCFQGQSVVNSVRQTVDSVSGKTTAIGTSSLNVYVMVLAEDSAVKLEDTRGYTFGIIGNYNVSHTERAIEKIQQLIGQSIVTSGFESYGDLAQGLYQGTAQAVIMNGVSLEMLSGEEEYADFSEKVRILKELSYESLRDPNETGGLRPRPGSSIAKDPTNAPFAFYISGSDTRNKRLTISRSDVNILVVVNPTTHQILLINTPRDYYVSNPAGNGAKDKLTHCGLYGPECSMQVLEDLYGMQIDYYGQINFTGFETLVDAIGGVTVNSVESFKAGKTYIVKGDNYLDGKAALDFARERYHVSGGDNGRGENQMRLLKAVIQKLTSARTLLANYGEILSSLEGMFATSMTSEDINALVKMQLDEMPQWTVLSYAVTGTAGNAPNYSMPGTTAYVTYPNQRSVDHAANLIDRLCANEILKESDMKLPKK